MATLRLYGDSISGNCLKPRWTADLLSVPYEWVETSVMAGATRTPDFLALNPWGQVPLAILPDGRRLAQSNAIALHLAEGSHLIPADPYARAKMFEWLFWEQYSHETTIAVRRFRVAFLKQNEKDLDPALLTKGAAALDYMDKNLEGRRYLAGEGLSIADIALVAYTRWAPEGGFDLAPLANVRDWISRVEDDLSLPPAL